MTKAVRTTVIVSGIAIVVTFLMMVRYLYNHWNAPVQSAGDVGDFVGGLAAIIGLVGTFAGFLLALGQIKETREQQEAAEERQDRLEEKIELIAESMNTLANNAKLRNALTMLENQPRLKVEMRVGDGATSSIHVMRYTGGTITFVNNGERAEFSEAKSRTEGFQAQLVEAPVECDKGGKFRVHVCCQGDLPKAGPIRLALLFTDKLGGSGWTEVIFDHFMGKVTVKNHMGLPE